MYKYDKAFLDRTATEHGFIRDNLEKVYRLTDVLAYVHETPVLSETLVLKGGTAINLTVFNMPRLSVDIDLDFHSSCSKEEMLETRREINELLRKYMDVNGYILNTEKAKHPHSLDSWVFYYQNVGGNRDNIKIEINYSMRNHILPIHQAIVNVNFLNMKVPVNALAPIELFGSKIKALLERTAARDIYDIHNMIYYNLFDESEFDLLRKCVVFYWAVGAAGNFTQNLPILNIDRLSFTKIRQTLLPVIRKGEKIDLDVMKSQVTTFVSELLTLTDEEKSFMHEFSKGCYCPELLFDDVEIIERIRNHPMALWKCSKIQRQEI